MSESATSAPEQGRDRRQAGVSLGPADSGLQHFTIGQLWWLAAITVLAGVLRLWHIDTWGLWLDEAHTYRDITRPFSGEWGFFQSDVQRWYPLSFVTLRALLDLGVLQGIGEGWLRLPFAFCGIVTVPMLALFGRQFVGRRGALLAALFLAVNPWHIYWSQNARAYAVVVFWATLAGGVYWHGLQRRSRWLLSLAVACLLVGGLFHPCALLLAPAFAAYPILDRTHALADPKTWLRILAVGLAVVLLPHLLHYLPPLAKFARVKPDASLAHLAQTSAFYFRLPLLLAALLGVWLLLQHRLQGRALFLACWAMLPLLTLGLIGSTFSKTTARYGLSALPGVVLLAGGASVRMGEALRAGFGGRRALMSWLPSSLVPIVLTMDMVSYDYLYFTSQHGDRGMWREAAACIATLSQGRPLTVLSVNEPTMQYYLRPRNYDVRPGDPDPYPGCRVVGIEQWDVSNAGGGRNYLDGQIAEARAAGHDLFVVATMPDLEDKNPDATLRQALRDRCELVDVFQVMVGPKDESIWLYRVRPGG